MTQVARAAERVKAIGSFTELVVGTVATSSNAATLVLPQFSVVHGVVCSGSTNDKTAQVTAISGNVLTFRSENSTDVVAYIAWGLGWN